MSPSPTKFLSEKKDIWKKIKNGSHFYYVQCDIEVAEELRESFTNFFANHQEH